MASPDSAGQSSEVTLKRAMVSCVERANSERVLLFLFLCFSEKIFEETKEQMDEIGICTQPLGGGFIKNIPKDHLIKIYGCCKVS